LKKEKTPIDFACFENFKKIVLGFHETTYNFVVDRLIFLKNIENFVQILKINSSMI
jgi:hypothetical protein